MATFTVGHHPELTAEKAMEVFSRQLGDKYDVHFPSGMESWLGGRADFVVSKSTWAGVGVWLRQKQDTTSFRSSGILPAITYLGVLAAGVGMLVTGGIAWIMLRPSWKAIEADIESCIENAVEFK